MDLSVTDEESARIRAPAALNIGADTPDEIAASTSAEIILVRRKQLAPQKLQAAQAVDLVEQLVVAKAQVVFCGMIVGIATAK
jgi:xanthine/CO dehydrogenase XdhC/CoxF family maturation factor